MALYKFCIVLYLSFWLITVLNLLIINVSSDTWLHSMWSRVYETVEQSVCLSVPLVDSSSGIRWVCFPWLILWAGDVDQQQMLTVILAAKGQGWTQRLVELWCLVVFVAEGLLRLKRRYRVMLQMNRLRKAIKDPQNGRYMDTMKSVWTFLHCR